MGFNKFHALIQQSNVQNEKIDLFLEVLQSACFHALCRQHIPDSDRQ